MANTKKQTPVETSDDVKLVEEIQQVVKGEEPKQENKSEIELMKEQLALLSKKLEETEKTNSMLIEIADSKAKAHYYDKHKEKLPTDMRVRTYGDKLIVGWKSVVDDVDRDFVTGRYMEKQEVMLFFKDGSSKQVPLIVFERHYKPVNCRLLSILSSEVDNTISYKLKRYDNGEEFEIGASFVN